MKKSIRLALALAALGLASSAHAIEIYGQASTEGAGLGVGTGLNSLLSQAPSSIGLRAELNGFPTFHHSFDAGDIHYDARASLKSADGLVDFFPFASSPFHLTAGVMFNGDKLEGDGTYLRGQVRAGGQSYSLAGDSLHGKVTYPLAMPYLGIGLGHRPSTKGWSVFGDLGVAYGRPHVDLSFNPSAQATLNTLPADLQAQATQQLSQERDDLQSKADKAKFYPIVKVGVSYRF